MRVQPAAYILALTGIALVALATSLLHSHLGLASAALLFLLPVLLASVHGGMGPALVAAVAGALSFNFFLLPPRFTFRIDSFDHVISVVVLLVVALVTSRLATALKSREAEARAQATASAEQAELAGLLGGDAPDALDRALALIDERYGSARLIAGTEPDASDAAFSSLDRSAAAWATNGAEATGHGSAALPASDWSFLPLAPGRTDGSALLAVARPAGGGTRAPTEAQQLQALARLIGQARDRRALDAERRTRERLEDQDALRGTLLAALAHDFRTPLTVLGGEISALGGDPDVRRRALAEVQRLGAMMDDLVGAARIESGALQPAIEAVDLVDCIDSAAERLAPQLAAREVARDLPADLPLIAADPILLTHILTNLLANAGHHAHAAVRISAMAADGFVEFHIDDDGPGVPPTLRSRLFERFARGEGGDRSGGSGLGLAIVKGFADAMGIAVAAGDAPGGGARFTLRLPQRQTAPA